MRLKIAPSILAARFERLGEEVRAVERAGADQIHVDVMDGHFVPNLSMGTVVVEALRRVTKLPLDVHLMVTAPQQYLESFARAGANHITFHLESEGDPVAMAASLRERGLGAGLAVKPGTAVDRVLGLLPHFDLVLVMTVEPGFGGQAFMPENLEKIRALRRHAERPPRPLDVQVDGGIDGETAVECHRAGANVFVAGSSIFGAADPSAALRAMRDRLTPEST